MDNVQTLNLDEQQTVNGGSAIGCLASGALFMLGVASGQVEVCLGAIICADQVC